MSDPILLDKVHLLMEETGCDQSEAELALSEAGYDVARAVRAIRALLRHFVVLKVRFFVPAKGHYGLLLAVANARHRTLARVRAVTGFNPSVYEASLEEGWEEFERHLYASRLGEGVLQQMSQSLERTLVQTWQSGGSFFEDLRPDRAESLAKRCAETLGVFFASPATVDVRREEINLDQFRRYEPREEGAAFPGEGNPTPVENLVLRVRLEEAPEGRPASSLQPGDRVWARIDDERDIAGYLARLLAGLDDTGPRPLLVPVEELRAQESQSLIQVRLCGSVLGLAMLQPDTLLRVESSPSPSLWRRWLSIIGGES